VLVAPDGCRPFDRNRAGISLGEGAGALLIASDKAAETLDTPVLARICGWGATADCHHMTAPHPEGRGAAEAMRAAIAEAGVQPGDIGYVAAHGTGTPDNDLAEVKALRDVFGTPPPFSSMKRTLGHTLGASGALESVFAIQALLHGRVPPSGGFAELDEDIGAAPSTGQDTDMRYVVKNAFGFGGNNACAVFSRGAE
jgi:3-oxoacyl-[acyl-carrier-protein] synthase II